LAAVAIKSSYRLRTPLSATMTDGVIRLRLAASASES